MKQYTSMDNQTDQKTNQTQVKTPKTNSNWLRTLSLGLGVIGIGILIGIGGYFLGANKTKIPQTVPVQPTPTTDPTAGWKIHTSAKLGVLVKYPSELFVKEFESGISFTSEPYPAGDVPGPLDLIQIVSKGSYISNSFDALFKASQGDDVPEAQHAVDVKIAKLNNLKVANYDAVEYVRDGISLPATQGRGPIGYEHHVLIKKNDQEFIDLVNQSMSIEKTKQRDLIFDQILSTFKFIQ